MFKKFENWFAEKRQERRELGITVLCTRGKRSENTAIYADLESSKTIARATLWESGEFQIEAVEAGSGAPVIWETFMIEDEEHMSALLEQFVKRI
jgi:hypothetical protein